jgi:hypothetical protein
MRERLLGYLLGALEADEQAEMERLLAQHPELQRELETLRAQLEPLAQDQQEFEPPGGLCERTCAHVARHGHPPAPAKGQRWGVWGDSLASGRRVALIDTVVAAGVCVALASLLFPAVVSSRIAARRTQCQQQLQQLALGVGAYHGLFDSLPYIPAIGNTGVAANFPLSLYEAEMLSNPAVLWCPGADVRPTGYRYPTRDELLAATGSATEQLQRVAAGTLAYNLGFRHNQRYRPAQLWGQSTFVIAGDAPGPHMASSMTTHHGGRGFNLLFGDLRVAFVPGCVVPGTNDNALRSSAGFVECGAHELDSVIGGGIARPVPQGVLPLVGR